MQKKQERKILVIVGPTAVGKSALAVEIARKFNGEIISADSRQVYRGLDVGTGKITKEEMRGVPHHLLDVASPRRQFSSAEYQKMAREKITEIFSRSKLPLIVGGTGHYLDAALGRVAIPEVAPNLALRKKLEKKTAEELFGLLKQADPKRAKNIDTHNPRRLVRAIEIAAANFGEGVLKLRTEARRFGKLGWGRGRSILMERGGKFSKAYLPKFAITWLGLTLPPAELKQKITKRSFARIREYKMIDEVRQLHNPPAGGGLSWKQMEALGLEYRYISRYLRGFFTKEEMLTKLQTEIWRYAKRQMTWFKRNKEIKWFRPSQRREIFAMLETALGD